jgi:hypothetical protein
MGALIQTKGTQRLANWFNKRCFSDLSKTRKWKNTKTNAFVPEAFGTAGKKLLDICDDFIAQNASATSGEWPSGMNDMFYPSATLAVVSGSGTTLTFNLPGTKPDAIVDGESFVSCIKTNRVKKQTKVQTAALSAGVLTVTLTKPLKSNPNAGELFSFSFKKGKHERLVRRWRWYLEHDLEPKNDDAIRQAISAALGDEEYYVSISCQTVEDVQKVVAIPQPKLDGDEEPTDELEMTIVLMTQSTSSPDKVDPQ